MGGFFWTVFAFFLVIQSTAKSLKTKEEEEHTVHSTRTHNHGAASQKDIERRQFKQLTKTLQHFLNEYKNLYKMAEDLKNEGDHEDKMHGIYRNEEHQSGDMNKDLSHHKEHSPPSTPEHDEHDHQRMIHARRSSPHNEHHDQETSHPYSTHAQNEHHGQSVDHDAFLTPSHNKHLSKQHQVRRDTETDMNKHEHTVTRRGNAEEINEEDHVRSEHSADEDDRDEELGHSGEGEHSGEHEGQTEKGVHQKHDEKHKRKKEAKEIEHVEKEMHKTSNHGDSHGVKREIEEMHEIEQMEKEVHKRGNHGDKHAEETHEEDHVMRSEDSDGEDDGDEELGHSGEGEHSGVHEGETEEGVHLKHGENHKRKKEAREIKHREKEAHKTSHRDKRQGEKKETEEMHEIEQMEKEAHKTGNHGDSHRGKKETEEMHEIEQMEKEAHKTGNHGDSHRGKKETEEMHEIEQMEKEAHKESKDGHGGMKAHATDIHRNSHSREDELERVHEKDEIEHETHLTANTTHSKEDRDHLEHRGEEVEIEGDIDHGTDRDLYFDGYHKGYEDGYVEARYHMDTSHDDDGDDSQGHGDVDFYSYERKRRVNKDQDDDDLHHKTDGHQKEERKRHHMAARNDDLHHIPMAHKKREHMDTHSDDDDLHHGTGDLHHRTDGNQDPSHERKKHHMATRDDDLHHIPMAHKNRDHEETHSDTDDLHHGTDDLHHRTDGNQNPSHERKKHHMATRDDDLHHIPMAHKNRDHEETHSDTDDLHHGTDDLHHRTDGNQNPSHERKKHHMATRDDDLHHIPMAHKNRDHGETHSDTDDLHHGTDDLHHRTDGNQNPSHERKKHHMATRDDDLHHIPMAHKNRDHGETHGDDDDLHHGTVGHQGSSHEKKHHMNARDDDTDDLHHVNNDDDERVHRSSHGRVESSAGHADPSRHERKSRHALGDASIGDVHHRHSQGHEKKMPYNLNDDTNHSSNSHVKSSANEHVGYHRQQESHGESDNKITKQVPSNQQHHYLDKERKKHHRTRRESPSYDDDFFIHESKDEKKDLYTAIFTGDEEMRRDDGGAPAFKLEPRGKRNIRNHLEVEEQSWMQQDSQNELDCGTVADQTFVYDKDNCRLCQCIKGRAHCETKPRSCRSDKLDNMCSFINGEMVLESTAHYDGCNYCVCKKREWVCTRLRCHGAQHDYVNYAALMERTSGIERHIDICMECDREPVTPVCGPDWRTYRSLCHARFCGNYDIDEIIQGPCNRANPCENAECAADEMCVPFPRGPCLSTKTRGGHPVVLCEQYKCVSTKAECSDDTLPSEVVCGEDGQTYPSECHLVKKSVAFAYRGPCRAACMTGNTQVCGTDGVLYQSDCHANLLSRHVDYPGTCESTVAKPEVVNADDGSVVYVNRRCRKVHENKRCSHPTCSITVIPEGSCCPVCGAAVSIRVDRDIASDLLDLPLLKPSVDFTSLETIQSFIRRIQDPQHLRKCRMTIDYTERNDLSVIFTPRQPGYIIFCQKAAQDTMDYINSHSNSSDPIEAMLAAAVAAEAGAYPGAQPKRVKRNVNLDLVRIRRDDDHNMHQGHNGTGVVVTPPHGVVFGVGVYVSLYWFIPT